MRKKIIVGNWKMNYTLSEAIDFVNVLKDNISKADNIDVGISFYTKHERKEKE